jgi:hypothetical protein
VSSIYKTRNQLFPNEPYAKLFAQYPVHVSFIDQLIERAKRFQRDGEHSVAASALAMAATYAIETQSGDVAFTVVKTGVQLGHARAVLPAAEHMVSLLPKDVRMHDRRGATRAAAEIIDGAISDFEFVVANTSDTDTQIRRKDWLRRLKEKRSIPLPELIGGAF